MERPESDPPAMLAETDELVMLALRGMRDPQYRQASKALWSYLLSRLRHPAQAVPREMHRLVEALRRLPP